MSELVDFLTARLDEDEQMATDATRWPWDYYADGKVLGVGQNRVAERVPSWNGVHIARHDPARVLREVMSKRTIVALHQQEGGIESWMDAGYIADMDDDERSGFCPTCAPEHQAERFPCPTLRALAAPFSDHPDFQEQWR